MTFPQAPLDLQAELQLATGWTGITSYFYQRDGNAPPVSITRGRPDEGTQANPSAVTGQLNNRSGRFSPGNPLGPYYGQLVRNTPLRLSLPSPTTYLRLEDDATSYASCPTSASLNLSGDLDVAIDLQLTSGVSCIPVSKLGFSGNYGWALGINADGTLFFQYSFTGSGSLGSATSTVPLPWPAGRISLRATWNHTTGDVNFYYSPAISGPWTQLGATKPGLAGTLFATTAALTAGYNAVYAATPGSAATLGGAPGQAWKPLADVGVQGRIFEVQLRSGIGGTLVANPVFSAQTPGATSFADAQGNTWTLNGTAAITNRRYRAHTEISELPPRWDVTGTDVWTALAAAGLLRRLTQSSAALSSALTRGWQRVTGAYAPAGYWPCEDAQGATQIASGLPGGPAIVLQGSPQFASDSSFPSSGAIPGLNKSRWSVNVPAYTQPGSNPANVLRFLLSVPSGGDTDGGVLARMYTKGTVHHVELSYGTLGGGSLRLIGYDSSNSVLFDSGYVAFTVNGAPCYVEVALTTSGSNVQWHVNTLNLGAAVQLGASGTYATASVGIATRLVFDVHSNMISAIGQISLQSAYNGNGLQSGEVAGPFQAWAGETAGLRFARLCAEEGIQARIVGWPSVSAQMGYQGIESFATLLQECEDADKGAMFEPRQALALGYRTLASMTNQSPKVTLDYAQADVGKDSSTGLEPTDDDQLTRNYWTVSRVDGSSATASLDSGPMSTQRPPAGVGLYADSKTENLFSDGQLADAAGWRVHLGTVAEPRYPLIPVNLARAEVAGVAGALMDLDLGDMIEIINTPPWLPPGPLKAIVWGMKEDLGGFWHTLELNTAPESSYEVAVVSAPVWAATDYHVDTDGCTLGGGLPSGALANLLSNPGFETGSVSPWVMAGGTIAVTTAQKHAGTYALAVTPNGTSSFPHVLSENIPVTPGTVYAASVWALASAALASTVEVTISWYDASFALLSNSEGGFTALSTSLWTRLAVTGTAPAAAAWAKVALYYNGTPGATEVSYWDDASLAPVLQVVSSGAPWTPSAADYPFDVLVGGEQVTVWGAPNLYRESFETGTGSWFGSAGTIAQSTGWATDGTHSLQFTATGDFAHAGGPSVACQAGDQVSLAIDLLAGTAVTAAQVVINWRNTAGSIIATSVSQSISLAAGQTVTLEADGTAPAGTAYFSAQFGMPVAGVAGQVLSGDNARAVQGGAPASPQSLTVVRSVNGVVKTHAAGEAVTLARPPILALI